jgi:regulation of enolase protein 1 (concanavalin A-like superfamily)
MNNRLTVAIIRRRPACAINGEAVMTSRGTEDAYRRRRRSIAGCARGVARVERLEARQMLSSSPVAGTNASPISLLSSADVGSVGVVGSAIASDGSVSVSGGGAGIGSSTDSFHFDSEPLVGNGSIIARVASQSDTNGWAQSGIMIRESPNDDARFVDLVLTPGHGVAFQDRTVSHNTIATSTTQGSAGVWLRLVRDGSTIIGATSKDGVKWTDVGKANIALVNNVYAGLCVSSHNNAVKSKATFNNVAITETGAQASAWSRAAADPVLRWESESFTWQGRLYIFGGFTDRTLDVTTECDAYDPASNDPPGGDPYAGANHPCRRHGRG